MFLLHMKGFDVSNAGKDVSTVVYRVGECVQELLKLWKEYESATSDKMPESSNGGPTLEIRIPAEHVCATNRQVKGGQLWGTDVYTDDSDLVAVLMHTGFCRPTASPPPPAIQELRATVRVLPPQNCYISTLRNNVRSRAWGAAIGCSFRVERCHIVKKGGGTIDLEPCLTHTSTVEPTLAPVVVERTMTTRAAASNALRQQRFVREVTLQYNLCNEPWIKYSISAIADKGLKKPLFTSARLKKGEVLYLESRTRRTRLVRGVHDSLNFKVLGNPEHNLVCGLFELCFNGEKMLKPGNEAETHLGNGERSVDIDNNNNSNNVTDVFRWSQCKKPLPQSLMLSIGIPLPPEHLEVLEENLDWEDIQWSQTGVWISGKEYPLSRVGSRKPFVRLSDDDGNSNSSGREVNNKLLDDALRLFDDMLHRKPLPSVVELNRQITVIIKMKHYSTALSLFKQLNVMGIPRNLYTITSSINCYCRLNQVTYGFALLGTIFKHGYSPDVTTYTSLINGLVHADQVFDAIELFKKVIRRKLCDPNEVMFMDGSVCKPRVNEYNTIIDSLCKDKLVDRAFQLLTEMADKGIVPDVYTYSPLIQGFCNFGRETEAARMLRDMVERGVSPGVVTFNILGKCFL
ncbi:zinc finger CCCH domain-containing protein 13-like protein isoform X1 [Tanacetum coccineum]